MENNSFSECGVCGGWHPSGFDGDCRDDENRFPFPPDDAVIAGTWTTFEHFTEPDGRIKTLVRTNDDDDDGYDDGETTEYWLGPTKPEHALASPMDYTHVGLYGQPVRVFLDGEERIAP